MRIYVVCVLIIRERLLLKTFLRCIMYKRKGHAGGDSHLGANSLTNTRLANGQNARSPQVVVVCGAHIVIWYNISRSRCGLCVNHTYDNIKIRTRYLPPRPSLKSWVGEEGARGTRARVKYTRVDGGLLLTLCDRRGGRVEVDRDRTYVRTHTLDIKLLYTCCRYQWVRVVSLWGGGDSTPSPEFIFANELRNFFFFF